MKTKIPRGYKKLRLGEVILPGTGFIPVYKDTLEILNVNSHIVYTRKRWNSRDLVPFYKKKIN